MSTKGTAQKKRKAAPSVTISLDKILSLKRLTATANGACWGAIGASGMIVLIELARVYVPTIAVLDTKTTAFVGTAIGASAYGILSRSTWGIRRCLLKSQALFVGG